MKRLLIAILLALPLLAAPAQAQTTEEQHLEFMGIPIDGTLNAFARKLQAKGMKIINRADNIITFSGTFAGASDCTISLFGTSKKEIWRASADSNWDYYTSWSSLSNHYFRWKEILTQKYGNPLVCIEEFQSTYPPDSDAMKWIYVNSGKCNYRSEFYTENGYIILHINNLGINKNYVGIIYTDWINEQKNIDSAIDDL